jgi:hypothetical protein
MLFFMVDFEWNNLLPQSVPPLGAGCATWQVSNGGVIDFVKSFDNLSHLVIRNVEE